jgi:hypothetical protein
MSPAADIESLVGKSWPLALVVEHGKLLEMARVLRATAPEYLDADPLIAVPTFTAVTNHWGFSGTTILLELGCSMKHVLHGSEEFRFPDGPLREGQRLEGAIALRDVERKTTRSGREMTSFRLRTVLKDVDTGKPAIEIERVVLEMAPVEVTS